MWDSFVRILALCFFLSSPMCGLRAVPLLRRLSDDKKRQKKKKFPFMFFRHWERGKKSS